MSVIQGLGEIHEIPEGERVAVVPGAGIVAVAPGNGDIVHGTFLPLILPDRRSDAAVANLMERPIPLVR